MTTAHQALRHDALVYGGDDEFAATLLPFVHDGLDRGEAVVGVTTRANIALLVEALGARSGSVEFVDADVWYETPGRTIAGYRAKVQEVLGRGVPGVRVIGEVAFGDGASKHRDWVRYESVLNHAFAYMPAWIVCPYDTRRLPPAVVEEAARTHPHLMHGQDRRPSRQYVRPRQLLDQLPPVVQEPPPGSPEMTLRGSEDLQAARSWLWREATAAGLPPQPLEELMVAVGEVVTNSLVHGEPPVRLWLWRSEEAVSVRVADSGTGIHDPLVGFAPPELDDLPRGGFGLWLARQVCRTVEVLPHGGGGNVHLTVAI